MLSVAIIELAWIAVRLYDGEHKDEEECEQLELDNFWHWLHESGKGDLKARISRNDPDGP